MFAPRPGDTVRYTGERLIKKYPDSMKKDKIGEVVSTVEGSELVVVTFGSDDFLVHPENLQRHFYKDKDHNPSVEKIVRKWESSTE